MTYREVPIGEAQREMIGDRVVILLREALVLASTRVPQGPMRPVCLFAVTKSTGQQGVDARIHTE
jgi:hypothetical protein